MQSNSLSKPSQPEKQITTTTTKPPPTASSDRKPPSTAGFRPPEQTPKCPRCDSPNTKFCYYNNYSLAQPRHFCKTCRRYWTKGGALRNVPIGGGCRKNKRTKSSHRNSDDPKLPAPPESIAGKYFPGLDFGIPFSRLQSPQTGLFNHLISLGDLSSCSTTPSSTAPFAIDPSPPVSLLGFNYFVRNGESSNGYQCLGSQSSHSSLASSIESLSTINADLHWKLQQQRLGLLFTGENQKETGVSVGDSVSAHLQEQQQPILFQSLEACKNDGSDSKSRKNSVIDNGLIRESSTTEWLFQNSYNSTNNTNTTTNNNSNTWNGLQAWTDLQQYSAMN